MIMAGLILAICLLLSRIKPLFSSFKSLIPPKIRPHHQQPPAYSQDNGGEENSPATNNHAALKIRRHADWIAALSALHLAKMA